MHDRPSAVSAHYDEMAPSATSRNSPRVGENFTEPARVSIRCPSRIRLIRALACPKCQAAKARSLHLSRLSEAAMNVRPSILCPVNYSPASAAALRYAAAVAEHFVTRLIVMAVRDAQPDDFESDEAFLRHADAQALTTFVRATFGEGSNAAALCEYELAAGTPAIEIDRVARERSCELIVMGQPLPSTSAGDGIVGTAGAILVRATIPVLLTPPYDPGPIVVDDLRRLVGRVVVAFEPTANQARQCAVAIGLAEALGVDLVVERVPPHGDISSGVQPRFGRAGTDLLVLPLGSDRDQILRSWTTLRASFTRPALMLALSPTACRSGEGLAVTRDNGPAVAETRKRRVQ